MSFPNTSQLELQKMCLFGLFKEKANFFNDEITALKSCQGINCHNSGQIYLSSLIAVFFAQLFIGNKGEVMAKYAQIIKFLREQMDGYVLDGLPVRVKKELTDEPGTVSTGEGAVIVVCDMFKQLQQMCKRCLEMAMRLDNDLRAVGDSFWNE